jgi:cytochrome c oxidase subunit IV
MNITLKVWLSIMILSTAIFLIGYLGLINNYFVLLILLGTFIKGQLVIDYFMELKEVTLGYRIIPTLWLFIVLGLISVAYYL